ncbi:MAG: YheT family hydrolase [Vicinamibacterales bacterium]
MPSHPSDYVPLTRWAGGHKMTVYAWARRRQFRELSAPEARLFRVAPETQVLAHCHWQPDPTSRPTALLLHGLEGSSEAHYIRGLAAKAWAAGLNVVRLNQRNCGGTEHLCRGLYHSGLTADPLEVMRQMRDENGLRRFAVAGYSLGGNVALKLAGELGAEGAGWLTAVCAVSPVMELDTCVRAIERRRNFAYHWNFVRNLKARLRRKARAFPGDWDVTPLGRIWTIRAFDEAYTAPHHGFAGASDYYHRASAMRVVDRIQVPTLIITASDDPFVPSEPFRRPEVRQNPHLTTIITEYGGHCGFVGHADGHGYDGYWAERTATAFIQRHANTQSLEESNTKSTKVRKG